MKRSPRWRERKRLYDGKRRCKRLLASLHNILHVSSLPQYLEGDFAISLPPYIQFLITPGPKFTPPMSSSVAYQQFWRQVFNELHDLERVLLLNAFFLKKKEDNERPNFYETLPYKHLHHKKGTPFPEKLKEECGNAAFAIESSIFYVRDSMICAFSSSRPSELPRRGVGLSLSMVRPFLKDWLIVSGDKDCSFTVMLVAAYQSEVRHQLDSKLPDGTCRYVKLGFTKDDLRWWLEKAKHWVDRVHDAMITLLPHDLVYFIDVFLHLRSMPRFPDFYLLCRSHKGLKYVEGRWPSRPIVGMVQWATSASSIVLSVVGSLFLRSDLAMDPFFAPLVDTLDFVTRLHAFDDKYSFSSGEFAVTVIDFSNMYSNFLWSDVRDAWRFWKDRFIEHRSVCQFTAQELSFAFWLFQPLPVGLFEQCAEALPFLDVIHCGALTLGEFLLAFVFGHTLFVAPGQGLYRQRSGFPMGSNAAPPFANLIDRYYEILCPLPGVRGFMHNRFIDDLFLLHPVASAPHVVAHLQRVYPPHLPFEVQHFCKQEHVDFLDVFVISLRGELRYCTNLKRTNYGVYMPWRSNNPRTHELSWIKGERARYLCTNSHSVYFDVVSERLSLCLARLHYPRCAFESLPLSWSMKPRYMNRKERAAPDRSIHVLRAPFHASMDFSLSRLLR